jgi:hypothetical protein
MTDERLARIEQALYHFADDYARRMATLGHVNAENMYEDVRGIIDPGFKMNHRGLDLTGFTREQLKDLLRRFHPAYVAAPSEQLTEADVIRHKWQAALQHVTSMEDDLREARRAKAAIGNAMRELGFGDEVDAQTDVDKLANAFDRLDIERDD